MEILKERFVATKKFLERLYESLDRLKTSKEESDRFFYNDSVVKRFEFTYEAFWKFIRTYLGQKIMIDISQVSNARVTFRAAQTEGLITEHELDVCLKMIEDRNQTAHAYDVDFAEGLVGRTADYADLMKAVLERVRL